MIAWKILRPRFWVLDRRLRRLSARARVVVVGLLLLLGAGGGWGYGKLVATLSTEKGAAMSSAMMPMVLLMLLFFTLIGLGDTLHQLYLASDLELLMVAPVPYRAIFTVKLLECSRVVWLPGVLLGIVLVALGDAQGAPAIYYPLVVSLLLAAMLLVTAVSMGVVILLARLIPPQRVQQWIPAAIGLASVVFLLGQQAMMQRLPRWAGVIVFLSEILLDPWQLALGVAGLGALAVVSTLAVFQLFERAFYGGWSGLQEAPVRQPAVSPAARHRGWLTRLSRPLPTPLRFLIVKEWLTLGRDPLRLTGLFLPPLIAGVFLFLSFGGGPLRPLFFWALLLYGNLFAVNSVGGLALPAVGQEGRNMAFLRSSPLSMAAVLRSKFLASWIPNLLVWGVAFLVLGGLTRLPLWQIAFLIGAMTWGLGASSAAATAAGALGADFAAEDPRRGVAGPMGCLGTIIIGLFLLLTALSVAWVVIHLYPESELVRLSRQAVGGYPVVKWLFAEGGWLPGALVAAQIAYWGGVRALWAAAVRRLELWEEASAPLQES